MRAGAPNDWVFIYPRKTASWIDTLAERVFHWLDAPLVKQTAGEVARECRSALWENVYPRIRDVSRDQAKGYVRAVAPSFVVVEVDAVLARRRVSGSLRPRVVEEATQQLVKLIVDDIHCFRPCQCPMAEAKAA